MLSFASFEKIRALSSTLPVPATDIIGSDGKVVAGVSIDYTTRKAPSAIIVTLRVL